MQNQPSLPAVALTTALNALLARQPMATAKLTRHAGKCVRLALPWLPLSLAVGADGLFAVALPAQTADLVLTPDLAAAPRLLSGAPMAEAFRVEGDGLLAADLSAALTEFDWVLALRPYLGDVAASRVEQFILGATQWRAQAVDAAARNLAEYAVYEQNLLAEPEAVREFIAGVDALREATDRLEARMRLFETARQS